MKVLGARCLVKEEKLQEKTSTGIIIPGRDKVQTNRGTVIAVGTGAILENGTKVPMEVEVGARVVYASFAGTPVASGSKNDEVFIVLNERDILCVLEDEEGK